MHHFAHPNNPSQNVVGRTDTAGENLAGLYALVATCQANGINPELYLADVLLRAEAATEASAAEAAA